MNTLASGVCFKKCDSFVCEVKSFCSSLKLKINKRIGCFSKKKSLIALIVVLTFLLFLVIPTFAAGGSAVLEFAEGMVESIFDMSVMYSVAEILTSDISETFPAVWVLVQDLVDDVIIPMGYSIAGIYLVLTIVNVGMQPQQATAMQFMRPFAWFIAAMVLIQYSPRIIVSGIGIAGNLAGQVVDVGEELLETSDIVDTIVEYMAMTTSGIATALVHVGQLLLPWLAVQVTSLVVQFQAYAAIIEIFVRAIFMPLSFGPMIMHGFSREGTGYLRKFFACCLKIVLMIACALICQYLMVSFLTLDSAAEYLSACVKIICIEFCMIALLKKCGDIANDVMGV